MIEQLVQEAEQATFQPIERKLRVMQTIDMTPMDRGDYNRLIKIVGYWIND